MGTLAETRECKNVLLPYLDESTKGGAMHSHEATNPSPAQGI